MSRASRASRLLVIGGVLLLSVAGIAGADIESRLSAYENEARAIGSNLPRPNQAQDAGTKRILDAEVAYALGDYDRAALMLFELSSRSGPDQERATYYLGEALFAKGDRGAARGYFAQVVASNNTAGKFYQPSLLRLVEIAIVQEDSVDVDAHLAAIDRLGATPAASYVKGKYAFSQGKYDDAIALFGQIPKGSDNEMQAAYYAGVASVAKQDLNRAAEIYTDLIGRTPKSANDRRVIELAQLALGRLYYERDQPSKAIDSYLLVDRKSDLFADALYEVAWVYVKGKQYDKALRALELLHLSEPTSQKTPTVRILEGNLRIRKAQMIRMAQISGTLDVKDGDPGAEYDKAAAVFAETHDLYAPSYAALSEMAGGNVDPAQYLAQIAGRSTAVFQATAPLPEAAAQFLREEPAVQRAVAVERDLGEIESHLLQASASIARIEGVLAANDRTAVYPRLQSRRSRIGQIQDDLIKIRSELADRSISSSGGASGTANRKSLEQQYRAMPDAEKAHHDLVTQGQAEYDRLDQATSEISSAIDSAQAIAVALRTYASSPDATPPVAAELETTVTTTLDDAAKEAAAIEAELAELRRELVLGRDLVGVGDEVVVKAREARKQIRAAQDAEHRELAAAGKDRKLNALGDRAMRLADTLAQTEAQIDQLVDRGIEEAKVLLAQERATITTLEKERAELQSESRSLGGSVLASSFKDVKARFYDIVIRTDVGTIDVSWAQKEDNDDDLKRLRLSRQRDLKQLRDEFKGILDKGPQVKPPAPPMPMPGPTDPNGGSGGGSPDKGAGGRVTPGSDKPATPTAPVVRPDNEQGKGTPQPKGGAR